MLNMKLHLYKGNLSIDKNSLEEELHKTILKKDKVIGTKVLLYVFLYRDETSDNPLKDLPFYDREKEAMLRAFGNYNYNIEKELGVDWNKLVMKASDEYPITDSQKDIYTYNKKMDQLDLLLKRTTPKIMRNERLSEGGSYVSFSTNIDIINSILKDITNIIQAKASLVAMHMLGSIPKHLRGGLSPLTKGKIKTL